MNDLRFALRQLLKHPGFTAVAVLTLALGIGANTAIFSLLNAALLRPLPGVKKPDSLVTLYGGTERFRNSVFSYPAYVDMRDRNQVFSGVIAVRGIVANVSTVARTQRVAGELVTGNYFDVLGVTPVLGRGFLPNEDRTPGTHPVVAISWREGFGFDPDVVGKEVRVNSYPFQVVGVLPEEFRGVDLYGTSDIWLPIMMHSQTQPGRGRFELLKERGVVWLKVLARLNDGVALGQAQNNMSAVAAQLREEFPTFHQDRIITVVGDPMYVPEVRQEISYTLGFLMAAVGAVLLVACVNVANLLLARSTARQREIAVRLALGSSSWRVVRYLITESVLLSCFGGLAGLLFALWSFDFLSMLRLRNYFSVAELGLNLDEPMLVFAGITSVITGVIFGAVPAFRASKTDIVQALKQTGEVRGFRGSGYQSFLVVSQVSLSLLLLIVAGLFTRTLIHLQAVDVGFQPQRVLTLSMDLELEGYNESAGKLFYRELLERVRSLPGVESASLTKNVPLSGSMMAGPVGLDGKESSEAEFNSVGPGYFTTMKIPLLMGREFEPADSAGNRLVAIINDTGARRFWPGQDPIGKRIRWNRNVWEIVGVAQNIHYHEVRTQTLRSVSSGAYIYFPVFQDYAGGLTLLVRTERPNPAVLTPLVRREIQTLDKDLPIFDVMTLNDMLARAMSQERAAAMLLGIFSMLALVLAAVGLYGIIAYSVAQRTREIGIRMALGAERKNVIKMVLKRGMVFVVLGIVVGLAAALAATRILRGFLFEVTPTDPITFIGVCALMALVALLACVIPARRAALVDPIVALRYE